MKLLHKLAYWLHHLTHLRTSEFLDFLTFLNRMDDVEIYYLGGPEKHLQIRGEINDYHWHLFNHGNSSRFFKAMKVVFGNDSGMTERVVCIQIPCDIFTRREIDCLKRLVYSLPSDNTNIIPTNNFSTNVAEAVSKHLYRIEGKMCTYTFK